MTRGLKPYLAYRDSGVPRLGKVPAHWEVRALRQIVQRTTERNRPGLPLLSVVREKGVILRNIADRGENRNYIPEDLTNYKVVRSGQFAMNKMKAWQGSYGVSRYDGIVSPAYFVFDVAGVDESFFHSAIRSQAYVPSFAAASDGVRIGQWDLSEARMREIKFVVPTPAEQAAIVRYLDYMDRQIRRYIRAKQKLIKLLEEQKQAITHHAVTRGLDPEVRFKSSGVEWLGDVPAAWETMKIGRVIAEGPRNGISPPAGEAGAIESFSIAAIRRGVVDVRDRDKKYVSGDKMALEQTYCLLRGDVLVVRGNGNIHLVGKAGVVEHDMPSRVYPDLLMRVRVTRRCLPQFLVLLLNCPVGRGQIETAARTAVGTFKVNNEQVRQLCFAFPPVAEQERIIDHLTREFRSLEVALHRADDEIRLMSEYRTRMIADLTTGKLDAREAAASLLSEVEETTAAEEEGLSEEVDRLGDGFEGAAALEEVGV